MLNCFAHINSLCSNRVDLPYSAYKKCNSDNICSYVHTVYTVFSYGILISLVFCCQYDYEWKLSTLVP